MPRFCFFLELASLLDGCFFDAFFATFSLPADEEFEVVFEGGLTPFDRGLAASDISPIDWADVSCDVFFFLVGGAMFGMPLCQETFGDVG